MEILEKVPLGPLTTFKIGGPAAFFTTVTSLEELEEVIVFAKAKSLPKLILGGGSNILISDAGFEGLVIQIRIQGIEIEEEVLVASAGENWEAVVLRACEENLWGIENLSNIPGTVGGAVVQNIGAYGAALSESLKWAEVLDTQTGEVVRYINSECKFEYRDSVFKHNTSYKDLAALFSPASPSLGGSIDVGAVRSALIGIRKGKFPDLSQEGTAGSFFKNPIVTAGEAALLKQTY